MKVNDQVLISISQSASVYYDSYVYYPNQTLVGQRSYYSYSGPHAHNFIAKTAGNYVLRFETGGDGFNYTVKSSHSLTEQPPQGVLLIDTSPVKGVVSVNGELWGIAPQNRTLPVGNYSVSFGNVTGYATPYSTLVSVLVNQTTTIMGTYVLAPKLNH